MILRTHKRMARSLLTTDGKIVYSRYVLRPADSVSRERLLEMDGASTVIPLDCALRVNGLPFKMTASMMLEIAFYAAALDSYQAAEEIIGKIYGTAVNDDTIRLVANHIGKAVFEADCRAAEECMEQLEKGRLSQPSDKNGILYLETDGAALNTRFRDENGSTWRENKLGLAFSSDNIYTWKDKNGKSCHQIQKREYISYIGSVTEFKKHFFTLARRNGYGRYKETVLLSDGATWIRSLKEELFPDAQQILDFFHLCENTHAFAKLLYKTDESKAKIWAKEICDQLEDGKYEDVLKSLSVYKDMNVPTGTVNLYNYISNNKANIDYPAYKRRGYFIGSGAIESGNKTVLQSRLKQAGMRWNPVTAQYMLSLKSKEKSGLWYSSVIPLIKNMMG